jgi:hypothetical protein
MRNKSFTTVGWEKYLHPVDNPFVQNFLDKNGKEVLWQIALNIHKAILEKKDSLAFVVHINAGSVVVINSTDYTKVLDHCLEFFAKKEEYEICSKISKFKSDLVDNKKKKDYTKTQKSLI